MLNLIEEINESTEQYIPVAEMWYCGTKKKIQMPVVYVMK
jgi:hypothetical protein